MKLSAKCLICGIYAETESPDDTTVVIVCLADRGARDSGDWYNYTIKPHRSTRLKGIVHRKCLESAISA